MLALDVPKPLQMECDSPIIFASETFGSIHLCIYYRKMNELTLWDSYAVPCLDKGVDLLGHAKICSTLK